MGAGQEHRMADQQHEGVLILKIEFWGTLVSSRTPSGRLRHFAQHEIPVQQEDAGASWIAEFAGSSEEGLFVRLQSWDPDQQHAEMREFMNKRMKITVEVIEDQSEKTG